MACNECSDGEFISLFYAILDAERNYITYCNCGHEPTVLIRDDTVTDLNKGGLVLGLMPDAEYEFDTIQLQENDSLLFYTDGLIDAANFYGDLWGRNALLETAKSYAQCNASQMVRSILTYRRRFVGLAKQIDDTSIVVVKIGDASPCPQCDKPECKEEI